MDQYCLAICRRLLCVVVVVCRHRLSSVTQPAVGPSDRRVRDRLTHRRSGVWVDGRPTLHGGLVLLRSR